MLEELIERIEGLEGPDREVDAEIASLAGFPRHEDEEWSPFWEPPKGPFSVIVWHKKARGRGYECPYYTASLDAAMSLVPEGALWAIGDMEEGPFARLVCRNPDGGFTGGYIEANGKTAATALCAAALRSLSDKEG